MDCKNRVFDSSYATLFCYLYVGFGTTLRLSCFFFLQDFFQIGSGQRLVHITRNHPIFFGNCPIRSIGKCRKDINTGEFVFFKQILQVFQKIPSVHPVHHQIQKDDIGQSIRSKLVFLPHHWSRSRYQNSRGIAVCSIGSRTATPSHRL